MYMNAATSRYYNLKDTCDSVLFSMDVNTPTEQEYR